VGIDKEQSRSSPHLQTNKEIYKNVTMAHAPKVYKLKDKQTWRQMSTLAKQTKHMRTNKQHELGKIPKQIALHKLMH
jgi:hypothetical protein